MISRADLRSIARERLRDARVLLRQGRYDGAIYLGGYVVELALKERICRTLKWPEFPHAPKEFKEYQSFKTHNLEVLLKLSGVEARIKVKHFAEWSAVVRWNPEDRYKPGGTTTLAAAQDLVDAAALLLRVL